MSLRENTPGFMLGPQTIVKDHALDREVRHLWFEVVITLNAGDFFQNINGQRDVFLAPKRRNANREGVVRHTGFKTE